MEILRFIKWLLLHLVTMPISPRGRRMRIAMLMYRGYNERDATEVVFGRDLTRGFAITQDETELLLKLGLIRTESDILALRGLTKY